MQRSPLHRRTPLRPSRGTVWPPKVIAHVHEHQEGCIGPLAGMPEPCAGGIQHDHLRASHATGKKSLSIAVNCARLCGLVHHPMKTTDAAWRGPLLSAIARLHGECAQCQRESIETYGGPLEECIA